MDALRESVSARANNRFWPIRSTKRFISPASSFVELWRTLPPLLHLSSERAAKRERDVISANALPFLDFTSPLLILWPLIVAESEKMIPRYRHHRREFHSASLAPVPSVLCARDKNKIALLVRNSLHVGGGRDHWARRLE